MPRLICNVDTCGHHYDSLCGLNSIGITGSSATTDSETKCSNFITYAGASNSMTGGSLNLDVQCQAVNCTHNERQKCQADFISIAGINAFTESDTECSGFCPK
ncbi:hypothetical protein AN396_01540 [Candidatus Epulonipiscium fishelsonii]|uniref:Uncharacterized protein n=1 Tax=Candidatus Epulonipiscium fishelsonii TaxID=77094 RepID=A0ACC8X9J1_9FIRM|nr:hypothetical protein AN396_01540 [Epulopiscium sp. SCG-B11WGA-EpuloA1]